MDPTSQQKKWGNKQDSSNEKANTLSHHRFWVWQYCCCVVLLLLLSELVRHTADPKCFHTCSHTLINIQVNQKSSHYCLQSNRCWSVITSVFRFATSCAVSVYFINLCSVKKYGQQIRPVNFSHIDSCNKVQCVALSSCIWLSVNFSST